MSTLSPSKITAWSIRTLAVSGPLCLFILAGWTMRVLLEERPWLVLMLFLSALAVTVCAVLGALFGACHASLADAFAVGVRAGRTMPPPASGPPVLHAVE